MINEFKSYVVEAIKFQQSMLESTSASNVQPDWVPGSYDTDFEVVRQSTPTKGWMKGIPMLRVFRSLIDSNTSTPELTPESWQDIGPANTVAMFTSKISEATVVASGIDVTIAPNAFVSSIAFFGLRGSEITVTIRSSSGVVRSTETRTLQSRPGAIDWLTFWFAPIEQVSQIVVMPITCIPTDKIEVSISGNAECARMVFGELIELGKSPQWGASWQMDNYTSADPDEFGYVDPTTKDYAPRNQVSIFVDPARSNKIIDLLISLRGAPTLFIGTVDENFVNALVNFGLIRDPDYVMSSFGHHMLDFEFKGFV